MKKHQYTWNAGRFSLPQFQMLGILLIIYGGYMAFQLKIVSIAMILPGLALATLSYGNQVDLNTKSYRSYLSILGFKTGKWKKLPEIKYINVYPEHLAQNAWVNSVGATYQYKKLKVGIVVNRQKHYDVGLFESKEEAIKTAKIIATRLNTKLLDYTLKEPRWIDIST
jgi:hypothetical protein